MNFPRVVVVGASKGGVQALVQVVRGLPADFPAPICVVLHIGVHKSVLPDILAAAGRLPAMHPVDRQTLAPARIFIAPPDRHMRLEGDTIQLIRGPKENHARPAIDPLFRSAARSFGPRTIGVVLSGRLDDGTSGMQAIKAHGGACIVQTPSDAEEPDMPASVLRHVAVDHQVVLAAIPPLLMHLVNGSTDMPMPPTSPAMDHEDALSLGLGDPTAHLQQIAHPSTYVCPDCKGSLWQITDARPPRFRCHTGHGFTLESLRAAQSRTTDEALWTAIRALQERKALLLASRDACLETEADKAGRLAKRADALDRQAKALRALVHAVDETDA